MKVFWNMRSSEQNCILYSSFPKFLMSNPCKIQKLCFLFYLYEAAVLSAFSVTCIFVLVLQKAFKQRNVASNSRELICFIFSRSLQRPPISAFLSIAPQPSHLRKWCGLRVEVL